MMTHLDTLAGCIKMYTGENVHWRKQVARNLYFDVDTFREGVVVYIAAFSLSQL